MASACRRICVFLTVPLLTLALSLALTALVTDFWLEATPVDRQGNVFPDSFVHSGLFSGARQLNWGLGSKFEPFLVYKEVHEGHSFMSKIPWVFNIFFLCLGLLWVTIGIIVSFVSTVSRKDVTVVGASGIYLWSLLGQLSLAGSALLFLLQFFTTIKANVLLEDQLDYGFSTTNRVRLGYSFWFLVGAIGTLFLPPFLMVLTRERRSRKDEMVAEPIDHTVFLY
uniref:Transmembrane protein 182 n=1 Tax=Steinernema glaseri TaxID=37863 RepID=A0A1I8ASB4_9BILA